jgi:type II secretory pathway component PulF
MGIRAARLAHYLESGMPLNEALRSSRTWLPTDALVAVRIGSETGKLAPALAQVAQHDDEIDLLLRSVVEKFVYLWLVVTVLMGVLTFIMLKIVPVFKKMFMEFELELPALTEQVVAASDLFVSFWFLGSPFLLAFGLASLVGVLYYVGWLPRDIPVLNWFALRVDTAVILRCLALGVRQQIPLGEMVWKLARLYPKASVRSRLAAAGRRINDGQSWCDSLQGTGLVRPADAGVLRAAERVGNLPWALDEMAGSSLRRLAFQMRLWLNILFPAVLVVFGLIVAFHTVGLFMPLVSLIQGLS